MHKLVIIFLGLVWPVLVQAQDQTLTSTGVIEEREVYYPGTEVLAPNEMRILACGTGQPNLRPKQAAACWLVELGNGDKFIFDIGTQSASRLAGYKIHYDFLDKVFISHLHMDHFADLSALWIGGLKGNRTYPLRVWGPTGATPGLGTKAAVASMIDMFKWDELSSANHLDVRGSKVEVTEFPFQLVNEPVFQENGVTIRSFPAVHAHDGAVSYILEWNGLRFAFSGDTVPNKWWIEFTQGVDVAVHESFDTPRTLIEKNGFSPEWALILGTQGHTSPAQFGEIMTLTQPRLAVAYHMFNDFDTVPEQLSLIRSRYDGPLALAFDNMAINVTKEEIRVRRSVIDEDIWPQAPRRPKKIDPNAETGTMSDFIAEGNYIMNDVLKEVWDGINQEYGTDLHPPGSE